MAGGNTCEAQSGRTIRDVESILEVSVQVQIGDMVRIDCASSKYNGVIGSVFEIQGTTDYAIVEMPRGTELRIERLQENAIVKEMRQSEKTRKKPITRWPKGDPEWFPIRWLTVVQAAQSTLDHEAVEVV